MGDHDGDNGVLARYRSLSIYPPLSLQNPSEGEGRDDHDGADGVLARYQALLASQTRARFSSTLSVMIPGEPNEVFECHGSATYESIEKATSPINGQEESYWLNCNYKVNDLFEDINLPASAMEIESKMVPLYQKLRFMCRDNIMTIKEVYTSKGTPMIICWRIDFRLDNYLEIFREDFLSNGRLETVCFLDIIRDLVDVLEYLHVHRIAHGNLRLSTTYCCEYTPGEYKLKLAGYGYDSNAQNLEEAKKADWADLGNLLHEALKILYKEKTAQNQQYELLDLCKTLQHLVLKEETPKNILMRHPALFGPFRRVYYINSAVAFIERLELERRFVDDDVLTKKPWTENIGSKEDSEKLVKYIEQATEDDIDDYIMHPKHQSSYDPSSAWDFIKFVSYFLQYYQRRYGADKDIQDIVGDAWTAESYFRGYQPKMLIALKTVAEQAGFIFPW